MVLIWSVISQGWVWFYYCINVVIMDWCVTNDAFSLLLSLLYSGPSGEWECLRWVDSQYVMFTHLSSLVCIPFSVPYISILRSCFLCSLQVKMLSGHSSRSKQIPTRSVMGSSMWRGPGTASLWAFSCATPLDTRSTWATRSPVSIV